MRSLKYVKLRLDNKVDLAIAWYVGSVSIFLLQSWLSIDGLDHAGILNELSWLRTAGWLITTRMAIVFSCSVHTRQLWTLSVNRLTTSRLLSWRLSSADHCRNDREGWLRLESILGNCISEPTRVGWINT